MGKKVKKIVPKVENDSKNVVKKKNQKEKLAVTKDRNLNFKSKLRKSKQNHKKLKQLSKNKGNSTAANLTESNVAQVVNVKNKGQKGKKKLLQIKHDKKQNKVNEGKQQKKQAKRSDKSNKKINSIEKSKKKNNTEKSKKKNNIEKSKKKKDNRQLLDVNDIRNNKRTNNKKNKQKAENDVVKLKSVLKMKEKQGKKNKSVPQEKNDNSKMVAKHHKLDVKRIEGMLAAKEKQPKKKNENVKPLSLRERMMTKLRASRFRYLNETLYNSESSESKTYFKDDPDAFKAYHEGYKQQVEQWPLNPLDIIISSIKKMPKDHIIADFGCGEARLAASVPHKVHSFDFVSLNDNVTVCDVAHTPLLTNGVHVVVFCLSLMGTNLKDYIVEANRVLKKDGLLKIAEVESRFEEVEDFIQVLGEYGFKHIWKDLSHNLFYFLDFKKIKDISGRKNKLSPVTLKPCLYKKR